MADLLHQVEAMTCAAGAKDPYTMHDLAFALDTPDRQGLSHGSKRLGSPSLQVVR
jgi:hypothetical protein